MAAARGQKFSLLHYHPASDLDWLFREWSPHAVVFGPELSSDLIGRFSTAALVSVPVDRSAEGIFSVSIDEEQVARLALDHFLERGLRHLSTFRFDEAPFAVAREKAFVTGALAAGVEVFPGWGDTRFAGADRAERPSALVAWLRGLPPPCGVFTCADSWGRTVARYAREADLRVPEDVALVGADDDTLECELIAPPLSSVMIPWEIVGQSAFSLVKSALANDRDGERRKVVAPTGVHARRSTELLAIDDDLVKDAVSWIRAHADQKLTVPMVARAIGGGRQRLERRFRRALDRSIQEEIRRAHVERAKTLLARDEAPLSEIARQSGFTSASLLNSAFQREVGIPPGAYRRRVLKQFGKPEDD